MPSPLGPWDEISLTVTAGQTASPWVAIGNPGEVGLIVPALGTATTVTVQVARDSLGTGAANLVNGAGSQVCSLASGSGGVAVSSNDLGAILGYPYLRVVLGATQAADKTFYLERKATEHEPL